MGKNVIFLPHCHSTNDVLSEKVQKGFATEGDVIVADYQTKGRGQRGNNWESQSKMNLLFSFCLQPEFIRIEDQFMLLLVTGLAIKDVISKIIVKEIKIKWPNDIYVSGQKLAGILSECTIMGTKIESAVIGIGCNINQSTFETEQATSILLENGQFYDKNILLNNFFISFEEWYFILKSGNHKKILNSYHDSLYWEGEVHVFESGGKKFMGIIKGINENGRLLIEVEAGIIEFNFKEVSFIN